MDEGVLCSVGWDKSLIRSRSVNERGPKCDRKQRSLVWLQRISTVASKVLIL